MTHLRRPPTVLEQIADIYRRLERLEASNPPPPDPVEEEDPDA